MPRFDIINKDDEISKQEKWKLARKSTITDTKLVKKGSLLAGKVISLVGKNYKVKIDDEIFPDKIIECRRAGKMASENSDSQLLAAGDNVIIEYSEKSDELSTIVKVESRTTSLFRKSIYGNKQDIIAANADKLIIMVAAADPFYNTKLVDRMLIAADMGGIEAAICVNKIELMPLEFIKEDFQTYKNLNIPIFYISVHQKLNLEPISEFIYQSTTIFSGQSGVGKSSLLNYLYGEKLQKILEISDKSGKGRHTTSNASLIQVKENTAIIDTPGIREFGLWGIERNELALMFDDFQIFREKCKYNSCTHIHEPKCAVKEAVEAGEINRERYQSYLNIYESLER